MNADVVIAPPVVFCIWMPKVLAEDGYAAEIKMPEFKSAAGVAITL